MHWLACWTSVVRRPVPALALFPQTRNLFSTLSFSMQLDVGMGTSEILLGGNI